MEGNKVNFDVSKLSLQELIKVYENIDLFLKFLEGSKIKDKDGEGNEEDE